MYTFDKQTLAEHKTFRYSLLDDGLPLAFEDVARLWQRSAPFRAFFTKLLSDAPFPAFYLETPGITLTTAGQPFEMILMRSIELETAKADAKTFAEHFDELSPAVAFWSLRQDVRLVSPCPAPDVQMSAYTHLANFVRQASEDQVSTFWELVGLEYANQLGDDPVWLSTSGLGVHWLHLRIAQSPRYYQHKPYRKALLS